MTLQHRELTCFGALILGLQLLLIFPMVAFASPPESVIEFNDDSVVGQSDWYKDPTSGMWTSVPIPSAESPYIYAYKRLCFDENNGETACLPSIPECRAAPDGFAVQWERALRGDPLPVWENIGGPSCIYSEDPAAFEERLRAAVLSAFQESPIAPGQLSVQPSPHTLIGAHTNVYVEAGEQVFEMNLLGQSIRIVASPTEYTFDYGDGTSYGPARVPGGPLPESRWGEQTATSHAYEATGDFPVTVTTFFSGEYSVNGGPMVPIDGRAQVTSPAQLLSVWRSESRNVADDCLVNPAGVGC